MRRKLHVHYDCEEDYLEVRFGRAPPSYFEDCGDDTFLRVDEDTGEIMGYAFFNVKKHQRLTDVEVDVPRLEESSP